MSDNATIDLRGNDAHLQRVLGRSEKSVRKFGGATKAIFAAIGSAVTVYGIKKITDFGRKIMDLYGEQERAEQRLASVIKATGGAAGFTSQQMYDMAAAMQEVTTIGNETIMQAQAIIATFKNVRGDQFKEATMLAADMAEVLGTDLKGASMQVAKALNDPLKGITALSRAGVSFTESQKEMIKTLVESGDMVGAQKVILEELRGEFGGAATAATDTFSGRMQQLRNRLGDLGEQIGEALLPMIEGLANWVGRATTFMENAMPVIKDMVKMLVEWADAFWEHLKPALKWMVDIGIETFSAVQVVMIHWKDIAKGVFIEFELALVKSWETVKHVFGTNVPELLGWVADNWKEILTDIANFTMTVFTNMGENIKSFVTASKDLLSGKGWDFDPTALTEGFETSIEKLPELSKRAKTETEQALEGELTAIATRVAKASDDFLSENRNTWAKMFERETGKTLDEIKGTPSTEYDTPSEKEKKEKEKKEKEAFQASFEGLEALHKRIQSSAASAPEDKVEKAVKEEGVKQVGELKKIVTEVGNMKDGILQVVDGLLDVAEKIPLAGALQ